MEGEGRREGVGRVGKRLLGVEQGADGSGREKGGRVGATMAGRGRRDGWEKTGHDREGFGSGCGMKGRGLE